MNKEELQKILDDHKKWLNGQGGKRADLRGADFSEADFRGAKLRGADLREADLSWTKLRGADLSEADLREADLSWTKLREADLSWTKLRGANFSGADLQNVTSIKRVEVSWSDHGECGRKLLAVLIADEVRYFCGCFSGTLDDLRKYISDGKEKYKASRTIAADFCESRMAEMMDEKGQDDE